MPGTRRVHAFNLPANVIDRATDNQFLFSKIFVDRRGSTPKTKNDRLLLFFLLNQRRRLLRLRAVICFRHVEEQNSILK